MSDFIEALETEIALLEQLRSDITKHALFVVHPGGKRDFNLKAVESRLKASAALVEAYKAKDEAMRRLHAALRADRRPTDDMSTSTTTATTETPVSPSPVGEIGLVILPASGQLSRRPAVAIVLDVQAPLDNGGPPQELVYKVHAYGAGTCSVVPSVDMFELDRNVFTIADDVVRQLHATLADYQDAQRIATAMTRRAGPSTTDVLDRVSSALNRLDARLSALEAVTVKSKRPTTSDDRALLSRLDARLSALETTVKTTVNKRARH